MGKLIARKTERMDECGIDEALYPWELAREEGGL
jgi:hypothetical protein